MTHVGYRTVDSDFPGLDQYDVIVVAFSGGKDSLACVLHLLELGVPTSKIELWHHLVDGREGSRLMDWPVTESYCQVVADHLGIPLFFSWKEGGFEREMLRHEQPTSPIHFETPQGVLQVGGKGPLGTRRKFPQVTGNLSQRYCSPYLKIDVCASAIRNQPRFQHSRTLVVTGERAEESSGRAKYAVFEPDRSDGRTGKSGRHVDHWRPVHRWTESQVWQILQRHSLRAHPAYWLGFSRCSCRFCIFGQADQWATANAVDPRGFLQVQSYEQEFGVTIHRKESLVELAARGQVHPAVSLEAKRVAMSPEYSLPIVQDPWELPPGAYQHSGGPT